MDGGNFHTVRESRVRGSSGNHKSLIINGFGLEVEKLEFICLDGDSAF